ncbi:MAG: SusC/RagA family TonB-linked outer membrane protein [Tannerellaceae bacterium]|nr:SusC/RagA family TonB-linked outer membrane protein [Tannerellaceae bacterium]
MKINHLLAFSIIQILLIFHPLTSLKAQNTNIIANGSKITIGNLISIIEEQTDYMVVFRNRDIDLQSIVQTPGETSEITAWLETAFNNTDILYEFQGNYILLSKTGNPTAAQGEIKRITGTVLDDTGIPVTGANIFEKGTTNGVITDIDGEFSIDAGIGKILQVSFIGYIPQEYVVDNQTNNLRIILREDSQTLEDVVVIGYGVAKKTDLTGSISQVKAETLQNYTPSNVSDMLRTSIPGMNTGYSVSAKGNSDMLIRGNNTLTAGTSPLIVVDGVIYTGDISDINPNDIEQLDIMKDASSAAVYGSRATNGVVAITTKKGRSSKPVINFSGTVGVATAANRVKPYDANGFIKWRSDMFKSVYSATVAQDPWSPFDDPRTIAPEYLNDWMAYHSTTQDNLVDAWLSGLRLTGTEIGNYKAGRTIDWEDHIFRKGLRQDYNLSLSGQKEEFSYYWSLGYMNNEALVIGDNFSTIRSRVNIEGQPAKFIKIGLNAQFAYRDESSVSANEAQYKKLTPYSSYYEEDGETLRLYPNEDIQARHPLLNRKYRSTETEYFTLFPKMYAILQLPFGITYTLNYTTRFVFFHDYIHNSSGHPEWGLYGGSASRATRLNREWQIDNILNWNKTFLNDHKVDVTLLANAEKYRMDSEQMENQYFAPNDILGYHNMGIGTLPEISSSDEVRTADAFMARMNYTYANKYLFTLSVRRDGSSLFGYANPHATFPATALGWVVSEEKFFNPNFIDYLKIRASWGINGNRAIDNYAALSKIASDKYLNADSNGNAFTVPTLTINTMENRKLKWEKTEAYNFGVDFRLFNGIISGTVEAYSMSTTDVLVQRLLPTITGFNRVYANLGEVKNKGFELSLNSVNMKNSNFEWHSGFLFSLNRNKIKSITGEKYDVFDQNGNLIGQKEPDDIDNGWFIGQAKDVIRDYKILGTWKTGQEEEAAKWNQAPGDFILEDVNNDGMLTDEDKQFLGYTDPRFAWTFSNNFYFLKNFEFSFVIYSLWGHKASYNLAKHDDHIEDRCNSWDIPYWTPDNQLDDYARLRSSPAKGVNYSVWFNQSYIRLENVALSYKVPRKLTNKLFISDLKVSFNIKNEPYGHPVGNLVTL